MTLLFNPQTVTVAPHVTQNQQLLSEGYLIIGGARALEANYSKPELLVMYNQLRYRYGLVNGWPPPGSSNKIQLSHLVFRILLGVVDGKYMDVIQTTNRKGHDYVVRMTKRSWRSQPRARSALPPAALTMLEAIHYELESFPQYTAPLPILIGRLKKPLGGSTLSLMGRFSQFYRDYYGPFGVLLKFIDYENRGDEDVVLDAAQ